MQPFVSNEARHTGSFKAMEVNIAGERRPEISFAAATLANNLGDLHAAISELTARIEPILSPASPEAMADSKREGLGAPLADCIAHHADSVLDATRYVRNLLRRLEI
jgi:hypothetical protein